MNLSDFIAKTNLVFRVISNVTKFDYLDKNGEIYLFKNHGEIRTFLINNQLNGKFKDVDYQIKEKVFNKDLKNWYIHGVKKIYVVNKINEDGSLDKELLGDSDLKDIGNYSILSINAGFYKVIYRYLQGSKDDISENEKKYRKKVVIPSLIENGNHIKFLKMQIKSNKGVFRCIPIFGNKHSYENWIKKNNIPDNYPVYVYLSSVLDLISDDEGIVLDLSSQNVIFMYDQNLKKLRGKLSKKDKEGDNFYGN